MILYIAEKPSLGRAIAAAIPGRHQNQDGAIQLANGDIVSWCIGHLLEQADPEAYDAKLKHWRKEDLPIIPAKWQLKAKSKTRKQLGVVKKLIKSADQIVHAGDPDREGQLLVDEVINFSGLSSAKQQLVQRCLISDLNVNAVKRSLENLKSNRDFVPLSTSALARARADWLYGINMTRLCTLQGQASGFSGVLSVGRVQTPLLGLVVHRDLEIEAFNSKPFYQLIVTLNTKPSNPEAGESFQAKWKPSAACADHQDEQGRVLSKALVENVISRIQGKVGHVSAVHNKVRSQSAPLPYSLSSLQVDAAKRFGLSAKVVLDTCQSLYEKHKLITYPRSDCRYLPNDHFKQAATVTDAIAHNCNGLAEAVQNSDLNLKSKTWNDSKVSAHHAIIPTAKKSSAGALSTTESKVYQQISRQYLMQFYPAFRFDEKTVDTIIEGGLFIAKQKNIVNQGWKALLGNDKAQKAKTGDSASGTTADKEDDSGFTNATLPELVKGQPLLCQQADKLEKQTTPPKYFTDATLLAAMTGISRYVNNPEIRKVLKETDGIGTEATRAGIIELLFKRDYLERKGKEIHSTDIGKQLITSLPATMTQADMTAHWESQLESISQRSSSYAEFMAELNSRLHQLVDELAQVSFSGLQGRGSSRAYGSGGKKKSPIKSGKRKYQKSRNTKK